MNEILKTHGNSINGTDDYWSVDCPNCGKEYKYTGFFDSGDKTNCECGVTFITTKVWIDEYNYIQ